MTRILTQRRSAAEPQPNGTAFNAAPLTRERAPLTRERETQRRIVEGGDLIWWRPCIICQA